MFSSLHSGHMEVSKNTIFFMNLDTAKVDDIWGQNLVFSYNFVIRKLGLDWYVYLEP